MSRGVVGYKIPQHMMNKTDELVNLILKVANEQHICNHPQSKVLIYIGHNEQDAKKVYYTFKLTGGERFLDDDDEE